jgi:Mn2+/Fe2+ NRAMP family transporter
MRCAQLAWLPGWPANYSQGLNLLQSVQLPFALLPVLTFAGSARIMGRLANG